MFNGLSQLKKGLSKGAIHGLNGGLMQGLNSGLNPRTKKTPTPFRIVIDKSKCGASNSTDFPFLFSFSDKFFSNISYGGRMFNRNGYDILFYSDAAMSVPLSWEIEYYDAITGTGIIWIKTNVSYQTDTYIYGKIGVPSINTFQSVATAAWNSNYKGVWHLPNGTTLTANDSTSNANNGTLVSTPLAITGKIDGGMGVSNASHNYVSTGVTGMPTGVNARTVSAWIYQTDNTTQNGVVEMNGGIGGNTFLMIPITAAGLYYIWSNSTSTNFQITSGQSPPLNQWNRVVLTWDGATIKYYLNGVFQAQLSYSTAVGTLSSIEIGRRKQTIDASFTGSIDEVNILNAVLGADWILTEYNNQSSPSTFFQIQIIK